MTQTNVRCIMQTCGGDSMTDREKRDFYKQSIAEMLANVKQIGILQYVYILVEDIVKEDEDEHIESRN